MGAIKNKALKNSSEKKFTLTETEINVLMQYRNIAQLQLDQMLQQMTSVYLQKISVDRFGYAPNSNLGFKLDLEKSQDNITIAEV